MSQVNPNYNRHSICDLKTGQKAVIAEVVTVGNLRKHFLDMGFIPGTAVFLIKKAPLGDPLEVMVQGYTLTLRKSEAATIFVRDITDGLSSEIESEQVNRDFGYNLSLHEHNAHPGIGENGKYHSKAHSDELPRGTTLTFALVGQPNGGKTSLFNKLTGSRQHVGNFPGMTADSQDDTLKGYPSSVVTDLPGLFSLSPYTAEEMVARDHIINEKPKAIINIIDANNIERNLYLTMQLMELDIPMVLALNMMDEVRSSGGSVRINEMERELGIPVVPVSAARGDGIQELIEHAVHIAKFRERPLRQDFCDKDDFGGAVHRCLHSIMHLVEDHAAEASLPSRFVASRIVEGDEDIVRRLNLTDNEKEMIEHIILQMEQERGLDRHAAMADMRFTFIGKLCRRTVVHPGESREQRRSMKIDRILTGKWTAIPAFILILALIFWLTFDVIGLWLQNILKAGIDYAGNAVDTLFVGWNVNYAVRSLVVKALFGGVGTVVSFIPIIIVLFFFLSILEDSGYMARIAFVSDKLLRKIGLSGRSIVPMLISFGCTVPGVMAARTLPSAHDRRLTIMLAPFMSCSAKIAIYGFFTQAFFPGHAGLVMVSLYLLGIIVGIIVALAAKILHRNRQTTPFVMELPVYRMPKISNMGHLLWDKVKDFLQQAFTVIFIATVIIWFLQSFDLRFRLVEDAGDSILALVAGVVTPLFNPLGLGDWRIVTALISGFLGKESVVSTLNVLGAEAIFTAATAVPMLIFCLLYTPCVAAIASVRRELGPGWALAMVLFQCILAWVVAYIGYIIVI